jgi:hypothetical protein
VFVSYALYGVYEETSNQQNNLRDYKRKSLDWSELFIQTKLKDEDSGDSQRVIANRLTSQQAL